MIANGVSATSTGWVAITVGVFGLLGLVLLVLFFAVGQPFGTLNDLCIALAALSSAVLAWMLYPALSERSPLLGQFALLAAGAGALVATLGSVLVIFGFTGWFLAGLYMALGNALLGLWLLALNYSARGNSSWPDGLVILGLIAGAVMALGFLTLPGILSGADAWEAAPWFVNLLGQGGALGWLVLYPLWSIWLGRELLAR